MNNDNMNTQPYMLAHQVNEGLKATAKTMNCSLEQARDILVSKYKNV